MVVKQLMLDDLGRAQHVGASMLAMMFAAAVM